MRCSFALPILLLQACLSELPAFSDKSQDTAQDTAQDSVVCPSIQLASLAAGEHHTCGLTQTGSVVCWGDDSFGQSTVGTQALGKLSAGATHTCGVSTADKSIICWGSDWVGEDTGYTPGETAAGATGKFIDVSAGIGHTCGVLDIEDDNWGSGDMNTLECWGADNTPLWTDQPSGSYEQVATGGNHACVIDDSHRMSCWGWDEDGQTSVPSGLRPSQIGVGYYHSCALGQEDHQISCWGRSEEGNHQAEPPDGQFVNLGVGYYHNCAVDTNGEIQCWGFNDDGQADPPEGSNFIEVVAGEEHSCARDEDDWVQCWGNNDYGQSCPPIIK